MIALRYLAALSALICALSATGQQLETPSLEQCREMARNNFPLIKQYGLISSTEGYSLSNASKAWIPQITLGAQASVQNKVPVFPEQFGAMMTQMGVEMPGLEKDQYKATVDVTQTLWDGGKSKADKEIAKADAQQQRRSVDVDLYEVEGRVDDLYFGILLLDNNISQTEAAMDLLQANLEKVRSAVRNGAALQSDADALEAEALSLGQKIAQMQSSSRGYRNMLEIFIGEKIADAPLRKPEMKGVLTGENKRPELSYLDAGILKAEAQQRMLNVSVMPKVALFAQGYYGYPGYDYFSSMMNNDWSLNGLVGVKVVWNLNSFYTRGSDKNKIENAKAGLNLQKDVFLFNTDLQTASQNAEISRLQKALEDDGRIADLRRNVRVAAESKLRNGVIDTSDLLKSITDEKNAMTDLNGHEIELLKKVYELNHTVNQ